MQSYRELRKREPELFRDLVVFQPPAAYMDQITATRAMEDLPVRLLRWARLVRHMWRMSFRRKLWAALGHFLNYEVQARLREAGLK